MRTLIIAFFAVTLSCASTQHPTASECNARQVQLTQDRSDFIDHFTLAHVGLQRDGCVSLPSSDLECANSLERKSTESFVECLAGRYKAARIDEVAVRTREMITAGGKMPTDVDITEIRKLAESNAQLNHRVHCLERQEKLDAEEMSMRESIRRFESDCR